MAKITRKFMKIFGSNAGAEQIGKFGSLASGTPEYVTDPEAIQALSNYESGWFGAILGNNSPAIQDMNALQFLFAYQIAYGLQAGVPEWNAGTTYYTNSFVSENGVLYRSLVDDNLNEPVSDITKWAPAISLASLSVPVAQSLTQTGMVSAFAADTAPDGWLVCDGSAVSRTTYSGLFGVIGITHGQGDGSTTFNIPDYRGRFLRGVADGSTRDPDRATRTAMNTGGNTGDNVGSVQGDATKRPNTSFQTGIENTSHAHQVTGATAAGGSNAFPAPGNGIASSNSQNTTGVSTNHVHTITTGGDAETRPQNAYVNYIIKT